MISQNNTSLLRACVFFFSPSNFVLFKKHYYSAFLIEERELIAMLARSDSDYFYTLDDKGSFLFRYMFSRSRIGIKKKFT